MAFYEDRPCAVRVEAAMERGDAIVSAINLGEVLYRLERDLGRARAVHLVGHVRAFCHVEQPDWPTVVRAAHIKARGGVSYADAFCVATAQRRRLPLWTGDPEIIALADEVEVVDLR
jgi:predicted nucleic acid-binding protein